MLCANFRYVRTARVAAVSCIDTILGKGISATEEAAILNCAEVGL